MSHTRETENYKLPQFADTDQPTWLGDWNETMELIDGSIKGVADSGALDHNSIVALAQRMTAAEGDIAGKAPTSHASTASQYGIGTASEYGHLKVSASYAMPDASTALSTVGASSMYNALKALIDAKGSGVRIAYCPLASGTIDPDNHMAKLGTVNVPKYAQGSAVLIENGSVYLLCLSLALAEGTISADPTNNKITALTQGNFTANSVLFSLDAGKWIDPDGILEEMEEESIIANIPLRRLGMTGTEITNWPQAVQLMSDTFDTTRSALGLKLNPDGSMELTSTSMMVNLVQWSINSTVFFQLDQ